MLTGDSDKEHRAQFRAYFLEVARPRQVEETTLFPGTAELLQGLHSWGVRLGIVSTKTGETISRIMERFGLRDTLELILGSYDVTHHKPHPEGILKALDQMGVAPEELLYCGDTILDAQAAQGAGVDFAAVLNGTHPGPGLCPLPLCPYRSRPHRAGPVAGGQSVKYYFAPRRESPGRSSAAPTTRCSAAWTPTTCPSSPPPRTTCSHPGSCGGFCRKTTLVFAPYPSCSPGMWKISSGPRESWRPWAMTR